MLPKRAQILYINNTQDLLCSVAWPLDILCGFVKYFSALHKQAMYVRMWTFTKRILGSPSRVLRVPAIYGFCTGGS